MSLFLDKNMVAPKCCSIPCWHKWLNIKSHCSNSHLGMKTIYQIPRWCKVSGFWLCDFLESDTEWLWGEFFPLDNLSDAKVPRRYLNFWGLYLVNLCSISVWRILFFLRRTQARSVSLASRTAEPIYPKNSELTHWCRRWDLTCLSYLLSGVKLNATQSHSGAERGF